MKVSITQLLKIQDAINEVVGYLTDNSCSDPDCCGGPFYIEEDFRWALSYLAKYGIEIEGE